MRVRIVFILLIFAQGLFAQRGKHGDEVVTAAGTIVNEYTYLTADATAGATSLTVANSSLNSNARFSTNILPGDLVMIIQMQGITMQGNWAGPYDTASSWGNITAYNNCGNYELAMVEDIPNATTLDLHCGLQKSYTANGNTQVIRVPRYNTLTINGGADITCDTWDGQTGGVLAIEVLDNTIINGSIDATGKGFRGGEEDNQSTTYNKLLASTNPVEGAQKGESVMGYQTGYDGNFGGYNKGAPANGGGGGNAHNAGGGGGGNGGNPANWSGYGIPDLSTASWAQAWEQEYVGLSSHTSSGGGKGGYTWSTNDEDALTLSPNDPAWGGHNDAFNIRNEGGYGGRPLDYSTGRLFLGGGGGAGDADNGDIVAGGNGGGLIYIMSYDTISGTGTVISDGADGGDSDEPSGGSGVDGCGGAGAGGTIVLNVVDLVTGVSVTADGGEGGNQIMDLLPPPINQVPIKAHGPGGGGGGGYIAVSNGAPAQSANGGANGTTNSNGLLEFPPNGATQGGDGTTAASITNYESVLISNDTTICTGQSLTLTVDTNGTYPAGMVINWYDAAAGGSIIGTGATLNTGVLTTTTSYYVGLCPGNYVDEIEVTVISNPDASITSATTYCTGDADLNFTAVTGGGSWSGPGITNAAAGTFSPSTAGQGTHKVYYTIPGSCGDIDSADIVVTQSADASITAAGPYCLGEGKDTLQAADGGGTWTGTGISNGSIGEFDPAAAGVGTWTITYTIAGACGDADNIDITVSSNLDATITAAGPYCAGDSKDTLQAVDAGGTWTGVGISNGSIGEFDPVTAGIGTHTITYTIAGSCGGSDDVSITVNPTANATISAAGPYCLGDPKDTLQAVDGGGTWSGTGISSTILGEFDPAVAGIGTWTITYTIGGACGDADNIDITVSNALDATITAAGPYCTGDDKDTLSAVDAGGTWTGVGISNGSVGEFDPATAGVGTHTITYTITGSCGDADNIIITVTADQDPSITSATTSYCLTSSPDTLTAVDAGGTWSGTGILNPSLGIFDPATAGTGTHEIVYNINTPCGGSDTIQISVNDQFDATIDPVDTFCFGQTAENLTAADAGGVWAGAGIIDQALGTFDPAIAGVGNHVISYTFSGSCGDQDQVNIRVDSSADASIATVNPYCISDGPDTLTVATAGGTWTGTGVTDMNLGEFSPSIADTGIHRVIYTISGTCGDADTVDVKVTAQLDATITSLGPICDQDSFQLVAVDAGGTWSGPGVQDGSLGTFDPAEAGVGEHLITYTIAGACGGSDQMRLTIDKSMDATITSGVAYCTSDPSVSLIAVDNGGVWSGTGIIDSVSGTFDPATAGIGTHRIIYSISAACPDADTIDVIVSDKFVVNLTSVGPFCESDSGAVITTNIPGGNWDGAGVIDTIGTFSPAAAGAGTHTITYTIPGSCGDTATITVDVIAGPAVDAGADVKIGSGQSTTLTASGGTSYTWSPGADLSCTNCDSPDAAPTATTTYTVVGVDANGCLAIDSVTVTIDDDCDGVFIPDAFSPNGDGSNDEFKVYSSCLDDFTLRVYDRWGEKVFETSDATQGWDGTYKGKALMPAVFVYYFTGTLTTLETVKATGDVTLVR